MSRSQCLWYALDKWHTEGGYLVFRKSTQWFIPHVLHISADKGELSHYVPHDPDARAKLHELGGFQGIVVTDDSGQARPMTLPGMFVGTALLMVLGGMWAVRRTYRRAKQWVTTIRTS